MGKSRGCIATLRPWPESRKVASTPPTLFCLVCANADRVAACTGKTLYMWDTVTQQLIASENLLMHLDLWDSDIAVVAVSRNGKWLAVASKEIISLYDASTLDCLWSRDNQSEFISFSPDDCQLVSGHIYW